MIQSNKTYPQIPIYGSQAQINMIQNTIYGIYQCYNTTYCVQGLVLTL
jgi:hypothetical protein